MAVNNFRGLLANFRRYVSINDLPSSTFVAASHVSQLHTSATLERARQHTRARKLKICQANRRRNLAKKEEKPAGFITYSQRDQMKKFGKVTPRKDYSDLQPCPDDDVFIQSLFKFKDYSISQALENYRESHHESQLNLPDSLVYLGIELSMRAEKKNRYIREFSAVVDMPHKFESGQRRSFAVVTDVVEEQDALQAYPSVNLIVGKDVLKQVKSKVVNFMDYEYIICNYSLLAELMTIRGALKGKMPSEHNGTAVNDTVAAVQTLSNGVKYESVQDKYDLDYAKIYVPVGHLKMTPSQIEDNIGSLLRSVVGNKLARRSVEEFITQIRLECPPSEEEFDLDYAYLLEKYLLPAVPPTKHSAPTKEAPIAPTTQEPVTPTTQETVRASN